MVQRRSEMILHADNFACLYLVDQKIMTARRLFKIDYMYNVRSSYELFFRVLVQYSRLCFVVPVASCCHIPKNAV